MAINVKGKYFAAMDGKEARRRGLEVHIRGDAESQFVGTADS